MSIECHILKCMQSSNRNRHSYHSCMQTCNRLHHVSGMRLTARLLLGVFIRCYMLSWVPLMHSVTPQCKPLSQFAEEKIEAQRWPLLECGLWEWSFLFSPAPLALMVGLCCQPLIPDLWDRAQVGCDLLFFFLKIVLGCFWCSHDTQCPQTLEIVPFQENILHLT